jgi:hypothetical protein
MALVRLACVPLFALFLAACGGGGAADDATGGTRDVPADAEFDVPGDVPTGDTTPAGRDGLPGWRILGADFRDDSELDGISFEWDYFMVHDEKAGYTGSVGYLIANPRQRDDFFGNQVPKGGNVAVAGRWPGGAITSEYVNFGYEGFQAGAEVRSFQAGPLASGAYGRMTPDPATHTLRLEGRTDRVEWDLRVSQGWPQLSANTDQFVPVTDDTLGLLMPEAERWTVDMLWPYTKVVGTMKNLETGVTLAIDGHGYRENSFGRWGFNLGGWDFAVVGDKATGVMWAWQTYHFDSTRLDYLDFALRRPDGTLDLQTFRADRGELGWRHDAWRWDTAATQCVPRDATVVAKNAKYRVEATVTLGTDSTPMLSNATDATKAYVIFILFPTVHGTVKDATTGAVLATFQGLGGGEFATARSDVSSKTDAECAVFGADYASPLPL